MLECLNTHGRNPNLKIVSAFQLENRSRIHISGHGESRHLKTLERLYRPLTLVEKTQMAILEILTSTFLEETDMEKRIPQSLCCVEPRGRVTVFHLGQLIIFHLKRVSCL